VASRLRAALPTVAFARQHAAAAACAMAALLFVGAAVNLAFPPALLLAVCLVSYGCGAYASLRDGTVAVALLLAALFTYGGSLVPLVLSTVGPWIAGRIVSSRQRLVIALEERTRELEAEHDAFARLAVRRERARIARDLHDIVAHHLAAMVVQAGAGRMGAPGDTERLAGIRQSGEQALTEMTRLVALLQSDASEHEPRRGSLELLLDQAQATGLELRCTLLAGDVRFPAQVEDCVYRFVQEGLTNAMKHAPGCTVDLRLLARADALDIELRDSGATSVSTVADTGAGLGLAGMRERIEALGGALHAGPVAGGGWRLHARVPTG
jgi:signal transduction histidine kinase